VDKSTERDKLMMSRALELAAQGIGQVSPGPLVGTVIVDERGEIAGEGFYLYDQVKHAEPWRSNKPAHGRAAALPTFLSSLMRIRAGPRRAPSCSLTPVSNASSRLLKIPTRKFLVAALPVYGRPGLKSARAAWPEKPPD
jgi:diaminohydroxyphosphoribosylaminopyrimidine deaminase/5-amino-6-(5-phosphoribosylamino)uracil reductase